MNFQYKHRTKLVYFFILGASVLFFMFIILIASRNNLFKSKSYYYTVMSDATGLSSYPEIVFKGYQVGQVDDYLLTEKNRIHVNLHIYDDYAHKLTENSVLSTKYGLTGEITGFELVVSILADAKKLPANSLIPLYNSEEGQKRIQAGELILTNIGITGIMTKVDTILDKFNKEHTVKNVNSLIVSVNRTVEDLNVILGDYHRPEGVLGKLGGKDVRSMLGELNTTLKYIEEIIAQAHKNRLDISPIIINANKTLNKLNKTLKSVNNNPLIKGGIPEDKKYIGVEIND